MLELSPEEEISVYVRSGFYGPDELMTIMEEAAEPGEFDENKTRRLIDVEFTKLKKEETSWPKVTDCDRLDRAFLELNENGIIALHNAGYTQSDGYGDFRDALEAHPDRRQIVGYCFYHFQDVERAVVGDGLHLAFGPAIAKDEETLGLEIGKRIVSVLKKHGLATKWNGTFKQRILIPKLDWKRRV